MSDNYSRILNNDSGSNYNFSDNVESASVPRSGFNWSYVSSGTVDEGQALPVMAKMTLPKTDMELSIQSILKVVNPPVVSLLSRQRIFYHAYWCSFSQLWKNAQTFFKLGTSITQTKVSRVIPKIAIPVTYLKNTDLANYLGFRFAALPNSGSVQVPALKFMMYIKVIRDFYMNKRIVSQYLYDDSQSGSATSTTSGILYDFLFPDDEADFRIGSSQWTAVVGNSGALAWLCTLKYRDYASDYFTSAQLTPIVGNTPMISVNGEGFANFTNNLIGRVIYQYKDNSDEIYRFIAAKDSSGINPFKLANAPSGRYESANTTGLQPTNEDSIVSHIGSGSPTNIFPLLVQGLQDVPIQITQLAGITEDAIRNCASATAILEKLAKTDGTYREFAKIMFGENPKSAFDYSPTYLGGTVQSVLYSDVVNTTGSYTTSGGTSSPTSPVQGSMTGKGMSAGQGFVGRFHSDDYGYLMVIMSVMPDTYYCQGLDRTDCYETPEDFYLPDRANLGMQAILNKEIYNDPTSNDNDKVFGYINRFDELRYNQNEVHGKLSDPNNNSFFPYIQTRYFNSCPTLSPDFLTTENNISKDWLSSSNEVPFIYQIAFNLRGVAPLPYRAQPSYLGL